MRFPRIGFCLLISIGSLAPAAPALRGAARIGGTNPAMGAAMPQTSTATPQEGGASVSGKVANTSGEALPGATVSIKNAAGE